MSHKSSMYGSGESSDCIVPAKCANKGGEPLAERMEGRRSAKEIPEHWADAGHRARHSRQLQSFGSACGPRTGRACLFPRWEPCALGARARVCAGGGGQPSSLPRPAAFPGGALVAAVLFGGAGGFARRQSKMNLRRELNLPPGIQSARNSTELRGRNRSSRIPEIG